MLEISVVNSSICCWFWLQPDKACDEMIGIGGGAVARDELEEARRRGKPVTFFPADTNHALATAKARKSDNPPSDFRGKR
jgi:hypothetical protein